MVLPPGAAFITERMLAGGVAPTATTIMAITTLAPPPDAGAVRLRGTMAAELPTVPGEAPARGAAGPVARRDSEAAPLPGVAAPVAPQDSEAALLRGAAAPAPITALSVVQAVGLVDNSNELLPPFAEDITTVLQPMRYGSLCRVLAIQMVLVLVLFFVIRIEACERGGGGRGGGYSREGQARGGGFSSSREPSSGARSKEYSQSERGGGRQEEGGSHS